MSLDTVAIVATFAVLLVCRVPVAVSMLATATFAVVVVEPDALLSNLAAIGSDQSMGFVFTVVPMFVLMGEILRRTTVAGDVFVLGDRLLRRVPGGMLHASTLGCTAFAAVSGSSPVTASTIGSLTIPQMLQNGYPRKLAVGVVAAGGTLGILIPPSVGLIVYGVTTGTSIGDLFLAGIIPGLLLSGLLMLTTVVVYPAMRRASHPDGPGDDTVAGGPDGVQAPAPTESRTRTALSILSVLALFVVVIGGIYRGVVTPTESAVLGSFGAVLIALSVGGMRSAGAFGAALRDTVLTSGMFLLLLIAGIFVAYVVTVMGLPQDLAMFVRDLDAPSWVVLLFITAILVVLGMFLDPMSMLVIMAPILLPTVLALGYSPVWFGVFLMLAVEVGMITPPVGFNLFVLRRVVPQVEFGEIVRGVALYLPAFAIGIALLMVFPDLALYLPGR